MQEYLLREDRPRDPGRWLALAVLVAAALLVFAQVRRFEFVTTDDRNDIVGNPAVTGYWQASLEDRLLTPRYGYAIPVTVASFAIDWTLSSGRPGGFHLTSLALHLGAAVILFLLLCRMVDVLPALLGALFFLLHPVQAEAVAFVSQRKDLLATVIGLLTLWRLLSRQRGPLRGRDAALIVAGAALASLAKPSALLLAPALAVLWLGLRQQRGGRAERAMLALLLAWAPLSYALNRWVEARTQLSLNRIDFSIPERLSIIGHTLLHYLQALAMPIDLAPKVARPLTVDAGPIALFFAAAALYAVALVLAIRHRRQRLLLGLIWLAAAYLPIANLLPLRRYAADCYLHLPMVALALGLASALDWLLRRPGALPRTAPLALCLVWIVGLGALSRVQVRVWRDEETLFAYVYRLYPSHPIAMAEYVDVLRRTGRAEQAQAVEAEFYQRVMGTDPPSPPRR